MELEKALEQMANMTHGRLFRTRVFSDFLAYSALLLSIRTDPVHSAQRLQSIRELKGPYRDTEWQTFHETLALLCAEVEAQADKGNYKDLLAIPYALSGAREKSFKQDFTPRGVAQVMTTIAIRDDTTLPEEGFFTLNDCTCGSGTLMLAAAERLSHLGYNPSEQLVVQVSDLDIRCAHMAYLQLSLYGIPAVVIHGDAITLKEYSRWYTPMYLIGKWIWRAPMPFGTDGAASDMMLKMIDEPIYGTYIRLSRGMLNPKTDGEDA